MPGLCEGVGSTQDLGSSQLGPRLLLGRWRQGGALRFAHVLSFGPHGHCVRETPYPRFPDECTGLREAELCGPHSMEERGWGLGRVCGLSPTVPAAGPWVTGPRAGAGRRAGRGGRPQGTCPLPHYSSGHSQHPVLSFYSHRVLAGVGGGARLFLPFVK